MSYSVLDDINKAITAATVIELTDDEGTGLVNEARVNEAIARADSHIDSYIGTRYTVPVVSVPVPEILNTFSVDMAVYDLFSRKLEVPKVFDDKYNHAIKHLKDISSGVASIGGAEEPAPATPDNAAETNLTDETQIFTRDSQRGF